MTVAEMIKKTRTEANMTQGEYGAKFGVSRQTVSSWENGRSLPDLQMLIDICNTYHVSLDMLENQKSYERGLDDLKLVCDAYIEELRKELPHKKLGNYIALCDEKNDDLVYGLDAVRGISIEKRFIYTKANMEGVSLKPYAVVKPDEFAYVTVTSRNGEKISLARNNSDETYICSSSYIVFKVDDTNTLWRRVNDGDAVSTLPFEETETMIKGVYAPERFLEIFRDYIYFQDSIYDSDEVEIVCRYPQFFAARLLKQSIINSVVQKSGKGGTYFGATGCGKTYTMAFLARQLALRCTDIPEIGSPTIILIVDRDELQKQGAKLFTKSKEFLNLGEVAVVKNRAQLRQELGARQSGGFYICTIQKFCDREDDKIGLINDRQNIICLCFILCR